jgi:hypothetical protein
MGDHATGMTEQGPPRTYGTLRPEAALSLLGNEVRAAILWTFSEARGGQGPPPVLSFSDLRERADVDVDSSQFNYHLQELVGTFVERLDPETDEDDAQVVSEMAGPHDEGYRLRPEGTTLVRTVRAWSFPGEASLDPFEVGRDCHHCGTALVAEYANAIFAVRCPGCEFVYEYNLTPPGVLAGRGDDQATDEAAAPGDDDPARPGDDRRAVLDRVAEYNRHVRLGFARGVCPYCAGDVDAEFQDPRATGYPRGDLRGALVRRGCANCGNKDNLTVGELLLREADLVSFCNARGLDVTTTPIWDLAFAATDRHTTVRSTDPWEVAVAVELDGDVLELVVDEDLDVESSRG